MKLWEFGLVTIGLFSATYTFSDLAIGEGFKNSVMPNWPINSQQNFDLNAWAAGCSTEYIPRMDRNYMDCPFMLQGKNVSLVGDSYLDFSEQASTNQRIKNALVGGATLVLSGLVTAYGFFKRKTSVTPPNSLTTALLSDAKQDTAISISK